MIKRILKILGGIAKDRWMHLAVGTTAALWLLLAGCIISPTVGVWCSVVGSVALAFWKEWYDLRQGRVFDRVDFLATVAGGLQVWLVASVILFERLS